MSLSRSCGFSALAMLVAALAGCQSKPTPPPVASSLVKLELTDSPVRVVGGSITARSHAGWTMLSSSQCPTSTLCYQSNYKVALDKLTVAETGQTDHFAPQQNWTVDVFDRNQKSPNKNGLKFCSGYDTTNQQCLSTGSVAGMTGPIYLLTENADSGFYNDTPDAPQDNPKGDAKSDPGLRFHDSGKCGTGVDLDMCERIKTISVTVNNAPAVSIDTPPVTSPINCDDGACKVHFGQ